MMIRKKLRRVKSIHIVVLVRRPRRTITAASKGVEAVIMIEDMFSIRRSDILKGERDFAASQVEILNSFYFKKGKSKHCQKLLKVKEILLVEFFLMLMYIWFQS